MLYTLSVQGRQGRLASAPTIRPCCLRRVFTFSTTAFTLADGTSVSECQWMTLRDKIDLLAAFLFPWLRYFAASDLPVSAEIAAQCRGFLADLLGAIDFPRIGVLDFIGVSHEKELMGVVDIICSVFEALRDCRRSRPTRKRRSWRNDRWMAIHDGRLDRIGWPW